MDLLYRVKTLWAALRGNHYTWPAIDISLPGNRHFHLIGSIHMGSHDMAPLPTRLLKKLKNADALIVEADVSTSDTPFANLPACEALEERISEDQLQNLQHISQEMGISPSLFSTQPLWQIAMVLQATQAQKLGLRADDAPRDKCTLSCAINGIHAAFHYLKKNYISGCVMTVPTG